MAKRVAVLGGGVAGLTVAHELVKWNREHPEAEPYEVTVFEDRGCHPEDYGGKCRSWREEVREDEADDYFLRGPGTNLPGEHGFRIFPGFYKNVTATMKEITAADSTATNPKNVEQHLTPLTTSEFFARHITPEPGYSEPVGARRWARRLKAVAPFAAGVWVLGGPVLIAWFELPAWSYAIWFAVMLLWKTLRWSVEAAAVDGTAVMPIELRPDGSCDARHWFPKFIDHLPLFRFWWIALVVLTAWWGPPWPVWVELAIVSALWLFHRLFFAQCWLWMKLRGRIPHDVKPRGLESIAMFAAALQLVGSCPDRFYRQWDKRSWWEYVAAYKQSPQFQLTLATGLTRTFVATKADRMSARTGGAILAQLIYDLNPYFPRDNAPDRVLDGPTSEVWITPWVRQLTAAGVRFNEYTQRSTVPNTPNSAAPPVGEPQRFRNVTVKRLLLAPDGVTLDGFQADVDPPPLQLVADVGDVADVDDLDAASLGDGRPPDFSVRGEFDHFVLAVPGPAAQQILGSSREVLKRDCEVPENERPTHPMAGGDPLPSLDGVFGLEFGWMTGVVFHLDRDLPELPRGHTLLMDSEWALTGIDERKVWEPDGTIAGTGSMLSVVVSDWFRPSTIGLPATYGSLEGVKEEIWGQLCDHMPCLRDPTIARRVVLDQAIVDPDLQVVEKEIIRHLEDGFMASCALAVENVPLTNSEKLLINTAGSWSYRPSAQTTIPNLFIAADYVRTKVDFASMESANEAARWAVRALLEADGHAEADLTPEPRGLEDPPHIRTVLRCFRFLDRGLYWLGWPNPGALVGAPFSLLSGIENRYRAALDRKFRPAGLPPRDE